MLLLILASILLASFVYWKLSKPHSHWTEKGVKHARPIPFFGDFWNLAIRKESFTYLIARTYEAFPKERYCGIYQFLRPVLLVRDPELIKKITVKDFDHFVDHIQLFPEDYEPLWTRNLLNLTGDKWREMRATLSPAFTSSKMKAMPVLMSECAEQFVEHFGDGDVQIVELKDAFTRFTNDVIASCAFGVKCDSLEQRDNEFYLMGRDLTDVEGFWKSLKFTLFFDLPEIAKFFNLSIFSQKSFDFFTKLISDTIKTREEQSILRPDMIHLLMEARKGRLVNEEEEPKVTQKKEITLEAMTAQALIFFFAGFDSASTVMCFMGYELGINLDIQERLRNEIDDTLRECKGKLTYEALNKMKYLDMIISETLRKWPTGAALDREVVAPYTIPAENPGEKSVNLQVGDAIYIPTWSLHRDPEYFPEPERFDPERFSEENKSNIKPYTYFPFGVGPRNCIGMRFALMEIKIVFFHLLSKFEILVVEKTRVPLKMGKTSFSIGSEDGFWFGLKKRVL